VASAADALELEVHEIWSMSACIGWKKNVPKCVFTMQIYIHDDKNTNVFLLPYFSSYRIEYDILPYILRAEMEYYFLLDE
jgi:hypothetical protein